MSDGYVYVASASEAYYKAAIRSAISLKDYYPEAKITLFTHKVFLDYNDKKYFDDVITSIPIHVRAKMWGIARSPYDRTLYIDCDTEIRSEKIKDVFDILGDNDIMFTKIVPHVSKDIIIDSENNLEYHGGVVLYNNKPLTVDLLKDWYYTYSEQIKLDSWEQSMFAQYNPRMKPWDQFTMWYLLHQDKYKDIKHSLFPDGGHSFNFICLLEEDWEKNKPFHDLEQVIYHYSIPRGAVDAGYIKNKYRVVGDTN